MANVVVIPARYGSTRFPGKVLARETGRFLIQHVHERVARADRVDRCVVATDDERVRQAVASFGGEARMTRRDHTSGTARVAEVVRTLGLAEGDIVLNVQGDEPELNPEVLDLLIARLETEGDNCRIATPACPFPAGSPREGPGSPADPNCVKVVVDEIGRAICFSRSLLPYPRATGGVVDDPSGWLLHIGVYAFRAGALLTLTDDARIAPGRLETVEALEQLRWIEAGWKIAVVLVDPQPPGVDTPEDYRAFVERYGRRGS